MALIEWNSTLSVKVKQFDEHHQILVTAMNRLHDAMLKDQGRTVLSDLLGELADYAEFHFTAEEGAMERTEFPRLDAHRIEHKLFIEKIETFQHDLAANRCNPTFVFRCLAEWLAHHIKETDQQYSGHLNAHGIS